MRMPDITWVFEAISSPLCFTTKIPRHAPVDADHDELVSELADVGYYAIRLDHKEWERWAWPGGYPIYYVCQDRGILCSRCANDNIKLTSDPRAEDDWRIVTADINYEDDCMFCEHCQDNIESAYGNQDEETE